MFSDDANFHLKNVVNKENFQFVYRKHLNCGMLLYGLHFKKNRIICVFFFEGTEGDAVKICSVFQGLDNKFVDQYMNYRTANVWSLHSLVPNPIFVFLSKRHIKEYTILTRKQWAYNQK